MLAGELLMVTAAWALVRDAMDRGTVGEIARCLVAGAGTMLLIQWLQPLTPFIGIPLCILAFGALALAGRGDETLRHHHAARRRCAETTADGGWTEVVPTCRSVSCAAIPRRAQFRIHGGGECGNRATGAHLGLAEAHAAVLLDGQQQPQRTQ